MRASHESAGDPRARTPTSGVLIELLFMMSVGAAATLSALAVSFGARKSGDQDVKTREASPTPRDGHDDDA